MKVVPQLRYRRHIVRSDCFHILWSQPSNSLSIPASSFLIFSPQSLLKPPPPSPSAASAPFGDDAWTIPVEPEIHPHPSPFRKRPAQWKEQVDSQPFEKPLPTAAVVKAVSKGPFPEASLISSEGGNGWSSPDKEDGAEEGKASIPTGEVEGGPGADRWVGASEGATCQFLKDRYFYSVILIASSEEVVGFL
jgi:hypothetical protein